MNKRKVQPRPEVEALTLIRQVESDLWDDATFWVPGERGNILGQLQRLGPITRKVWLEAMFTNAREVRLAIWEFSAAGNRVLEDEHAVCANLPRNGTYQDLANLIAEYSLSRWGNTVVEGMAADIREAVRDA